MPPLMGVVTGVIVIASPNCSKLISFLSKLNVSTAQ